MPSARAKGPEAGAGRLALPLGAAFGLIGFAALGAQSLLLREALVAWQGSEASLGVALALWLAGAGAGSAIGSALVPRLRSPGSALAWSLFALGALTPPAVAAARLGRVALGIPGGEAAGLLPLAAVTAAAVLPVAMLSGLSFTVGIGAARARGLGAARSVARVYVLEALGGAAASLALSYLLFGRTEPLVQALVVSLAAALGGIAALPPAAPGRLGSLVLLWIAAGAAGAGAVGPAGARLELALASRAWRDAGFVRQAHSVYGIAVAARRGSQESLFENGVLVASVPDRLAAEEAVHFTLLEHPAPARVLLLGGAAGGAVAEALKHPTVARVDCVDLDPALVRLAGEALGDAMVGPLRDPRVAVHYADARFFVKRARGPYDAVLVNVPDPTTAQLNRFYTVEFFREVSALLAPGGVVGVSVSSSESYIDPELAALLGSVRATMRSVFDHVVALPGSPCHFVGSRDPGSLTRDPVDLSSRVTARSLDVVHVRDYYLMDRLGADRSAYLDEALAGADARVNTDLRPSCYHLSLLLWTRRLSPGASSLIAAARDAGPMAAAGAAAAIALALAAGLARGVRTAGARAVVYAAVAAAGFTEIGVELAALVSFQSLYGFVYHRVALFAGAFMAGLAAGGWLGGRAAERGAGMGALAWLAGAIAVVPVLFGGAASGIAELPPGAAAAGASVLPLLVVGSAGLAGAQFPIAARLLAGAGGAARAGGRLYGVDLAGAAVGAVASGLLLLPALGVVATMADLALLSAAPAVTAALAAALRARP